MFPFRTDLHQGWLTPVALWQSLETLLWPRRYKERSGYRLQAHLAWESPQHKMRESQVSTEDRELRFRIFIVLWLQTVKEGVVLDSSDISPGCIFRNSLPIGWFSFKICNQKAFPNPYPLRTSTESHSCFVLSAQAFQSWQLWCLSDRVSFSV